MSPDTQVKHMDDFAKIVNFIKNNRAAMRFSPTSYNVKVFSGGSKAAAVVKGTSEISVGRNQPKTGECSYQFELKKEAGYVYLSAFGTDCFDATVYKLPDGISQQP
jgi:hypothetical protein